MNLSYRCLRCDRINHVALDDATVELACAQCGGKVAVPEDACAAGRLQRCLACPSTDLFIRKDFPQRLGVTVVVLGFAASCVAWYLHWIYSTFAILFATALVDLALYFLVGNALICYRCGAVYRDVPGAGEHGGFQLETHERYRQERARLAATAMKRDMAER